MIKRKALISTTTTVITLLYGLLNSKGSRAFDVYWNIPSFMCKQYGLDFSHLGYTYGVAQNPKDSFRGNVFTILYDPGKFPAIFEKKDTNVLYKRNGGVPQEGNLTEHLEIFRMHVEQQMPDPNFPGVAVIDFESWRPIYRQNFGSLQPYKDLSMKIEKDRHPLYNKKMLEAEATRRFEATGQDFMAQTLTLAKQLRPQASWGYYAFPYCFNMNGHPANQREDCVAEVQRENDRIQWLFDDSDIIFPSVYLREKLSPGDRVKLVRGRVKEAVRVARNVRGFPYGQKPPVLTYMRYVYTDTIGYLTESDWINTLNAMKQLGSDGVILWGSSYDLNTREKCFEFKNYMDNTLGPILVSLQRRYFVEGLKLSDDVGC
ncbi:hyaluronidase Tab y 2.0101-like [Uranotaenia lowii]|uniref:hyaluronidase Tab y 2.0101-like n=1 Tax=Uranotaenia lowii TaxID=190385 RepID=UPI00247A47B6|nr:hyaluronidase Tab y 2.0101-like [Uranotaenia lowii]XP_055598239.1 hyaluronidase Tab y 2.0101-like [Uranotaenia lowii]XP_055598240.1 hyaluronidase Tab y 2.0101-like [Uranotaenia lowii]